MGRNADRNTLVGIELVRRLSDEGDRLFTTARARELAPEVGISHGYLVEALHHLAKAGWIVRLRRGLYAISSSREGTVPAHEFEIAMALVRPAAISYWSALHHHGLTDQTPHTVFVLTTTEASPPRVRGKARRSSPGYPVGRVVYRFIQVRPERFFGVQDVWVGEARVSVTDPERTLLDGLSAPGYCGDFAEVLHAFEVRGHGIDVEKAASYALRLDAAVAKRLGWVLESLGIGGEGIARLSDLPVTGYSKLDPTGPDTGPRNRRWMIRENLPGRAAK